MSYKVVVDSSGELTEEMKESGVFVTASLQMQVGDKHFVDDDTFNQKEFLKDIAECSECPKSSCPSPETYMKLYHGDAERVYAVTLSAELSGSYNSAVLGKNLFEEEGGEKQIHVFNSKSASIGESLIALKIRECEEAGMSFEEVVQTVSDYIETQHTYFVLENIDTLRKNGRLTGIKALVAGALNIKPILGSTPAGSICQKGQARGMKKALAKMITHIVNEAGDYKGKTLAISHCNCEERAIEVKNALVSALGIDSYILVNTAGISSMYANDGGIIVVL